MSLYVKPKDEVIKTLNSNLETGLSSQKVNELLLKFGENRLQEKKKELADQVLSGEGVGSGSFTREELKEIIGVL